MEESGLIFKNWRCRSSQLGKIMTNLISFTEKDKARIEELESERDTGLNKNGNKVKFEGTKKPEELQALIKKRDTPDELPTGAKSYLDEVFNDVFWNRKETLDNKYLEKGLICEQDVLDLLSKTEKKLYLKNEKRLDDEYTTGCFDTEESREITDTKANYSKKTFDSAEMNSLYDWQIKDYCRKKGYKKGWLCYGLVNSPMHHITNEITKMLYATGNPDNDDEKWIETKRQIERNHIFDQSRFKKEYPYYVFENKEWKYDIPAQFRIKKFPVEVHEDDSYNIVKRILMSRVYLCQKEREIRDRMEKL